MLLLLFGIGCTLTGVRYRKPNYLKNRREAHREKFIGKSGMKELYLTLGVVCIVFGLVALLFF